MLFLGLESGGPKYGDIHSRCLRLKIFAPLSFDQVWSILAISISASLPLDFGLGSLNFRDLPV